MTRVGALICAALFAGEASAQGMGYSAGGHQPRPDYVEERPADDGLNVDWLDLPSDMTLNKWAQQQYQAHFDELDTNGDTVLSEEDLQRPAPELAQRWAEDEIREIFTVWLPDLSSHLRDLEMKAEGFGAEHKMLAPAAKGGQQVRAVLEGLGVLGRDWSDTYLSARLAGDAQVKSAGAVAEGARAWVSVEVPVDLVFHQGAGSDPQVYSYTATLLGIQRFPRHENEARFALWDIGMAGR
jgi:hypothetical protein